MKIAVKLILLLAIAFLSVQASFASAPYVLGDGGYYYGADGAKYLRKDNWTWIDGYYYWSHGCRYWKQGSWRFDGYTYTKVEAAISYKTPGWRDKLLDIAAAREESEAFLTAVQVMGLARSVQTYGAQSYATGGNAIYSSSSVSDVYGSTDTALLFQQSAALAKDGLAFGDRGSDRFMKMVDAERDRALRVAEILAKGQTAAQVLRAAEAAPSASTRTHETRVVPLAQVSQRRQAAITSCIQCHGSKDPEGGYRVELHWSLPPEQQLKVVERLVAEEADPRFMPRQGKRLAADVIMEFIPLGERAKLR